SSLAAGHHLALAGDVEAQPAHLVQPRDPNLQGVARMDERAQADRRDLPADRLGGGPGRVARLERPGDERELGDSWKERAAGEVAGKKRAPGADREARQPAGAVPGDARREELNAQPTRAHTSVIASLSSNEKRRRRGTSGRCRLRRTNSVISA